MNARWLAAFATFVLASAGGCSGGADSGDAGVPDAAGSDGSQPDASPRDGSMGSPDGTPPDATPPDGGTGLPDGATPSSDLVAEPSFRTVGLRLDHDQGDCDPDCDAVTVQYREAGESTWKDAHDMVYGPGGWEGVYRGVIVNLIEDTTYEVLVTVAGTTEHYQTFTTWKDTADWSISETITPTSGPVDVDTSGTPGNYVLYDLTGLTISGGSNCFTVDASHVIVRGGVCANQTDTPVKLRDPNTDILIEGTEIHGFSFPSTAGERNEPVIEVGQNDGENNMHRVVIQNVHVHDPAWGLPTSDWGSALYGIMVREEHGGNHVFRYNTLDATNEHMWRDAIGGFLNHSEWGFGGENTNIYGNYISHCGDDCIEVEGGVANVKVFENYMTDFGVAIAVGGVARGPVWIFRNAVGEADGLARGDDVRSGHIKGGTDTLSACDPCGSDYGQHFIYHNTFVNIPGTEDGSQVTAGNHWSLGPKAQHTANNIWVTKEGTEALGDNACFYDDQGSSSENDMYWPSEGLNSCWTTSGLIRAQPDWNEFSGVVGPGEAYSATLATGTSGHDDGTVIPNFSDGYTGAAPDIGAMEHDQAAMCFGHNC